MSSTQVSRQASYPEITYQDGRPCMYAGSIRYNIQPTKKYDYENTWLRQEGGGHQIQQGYDKPQLEYDSQERGQLGNAH